jgi:cob(I)alamin adenosyltransferase
MRISKVYTRTGDEGETSLGTGVRASKASPRVRAYGEVDELNSFLGLARTHLQTKNADVALQELLARIQNELFILGADLAVPLPGLSHTPDRQRRVSQGEIDGLEAAIDHYNETLPPLEEFILPAGNEAGATLHVARAVARRAEREVVHLTQSETLNPHVLPYLNRLSDLLFVLARVANRRGGSDEVFAEFH